MSLAGACAVFGAGTATASATTPAPFATSKHRGAVSATLRAVDRDPLGTGRFTDLTLQVKVRGRVVLRRRLTPPVVRADRPELHLVDVTGDGRPDPLVFVPDDGRFDHNTWAMVLSRGSSFRPPRYLRVAGESSVQDTDRPRDGRAELVLEDFRFALRYAATSELYADPLPTRVKRISGTGVLADVTTSKPAFLADCAQAARREYERAQDPPDPSVASRDKQLRHVRQALVATLADLVSAGQLEAAKALAASAAAAGELEAPADTRFSTTIAQDLERFGYLDDWRAIGLPA